MVTALTPLSSIDMWCTVIWLYFALKIFRTLLFHAVLSIIIIMYLQCRHILSPPLGSDALQLVEELSKGSSCSLAVRDSVLIIVHLGKFFLNATTLLKFCQVPYTVQCNNCHP